MKHRLLLPLMICVLALAGCYRQAEEEFQQVNSSEVEQIDSAAPVVTAIHLSESEVLAPEQPVTGDTVSGDGEAPTPAGGFITPEPPPGQVEQPAIIVPTSIVVIAATPGEAATRRFTLPTATRTFEETLDPDDECVYSVLPGDNLFRLSIAFGTTVEAFFEENSLESDALQIGQLLVVPGCEPTEPEAPAAGPVVVATAEPEEEVAIPTDSSAATTIQMPEGPQIHVVSAGETWASIALRYELRVEELLDANESFISDQIFIGQELVIPEPGEEAPAEDEAPAEEDAPVEEEDAPAEEGAEEATEG
ncbi:MAG: LysM peptidoglycan-binding domain-containing protein [Chloroflexi bacterium]|nr:LysM peptidoglycan-binding domain-containing protein [Chloroflexota bacterium]